MAKKILIVDDDPVGGTLMQARLVKAGYAVVVERDGALGLLRLKKERPDAVLLDIEMPEVNGYTFLTVMKKDPLVAGIPVIVQTSHAENQPLFARRGIKHYLVKPVNLDALITLLRQILGE